MIWNLKCYQIVSIMCYLHKITVDRTDLIKLDKIMQKKACNQ